MANQRLTFEQAKSLLRAEGTAASIAKTFNVSHQTVRIYKSLDSKLAISANMELLALGLELVPLMVRGSFKFTAAQIASIKKSEAVSGDVAEHYGCSPSLIRMIRTGQAYAHKSQGNAPREGSKQ